MFSKQIKPILPIEANIVTDCMNWHATNKPEFKFCSQPNSELTDFSDKNKYTGGEKEEENPSSNDWKPDQNSYFIHLVFNTIFDEQLASTTKQHLSTGGHGTVVRSSIRGAHVHFLQMVDAALRSSCRDGLTLICVCVNYSLVRATSKPVHITLFFTHPSVKCTVERHRAAWLRRLRWWFLDNSQVIGS